MSALLEAVAWPSVWSTLVDAADVSTLERASIVSAETDTPARVVALLCAINDAQDGAVRDAVASALAPECDAEAAGIVAAWMVWMAWGFEMSLWAVAGHPAVVQPPETLPDPSLPEPGSEAMTWFARAAALPPASQ
ncbi:hypothetical protein FRAHR75_400007 [Frankia sp. Hr75.2]|nr:hypothetical protein FRAHR75_400007 [Frankia sp. Hr75.2]